MIESQPALRSGLTAASKFWTTLFFTRNWMIGAAVNGYGLKICKRQNNVPAGHGRSTAARMQASSEEIASTAIRTFMWSLRLPLKITCKSQLADSVVMLAVTLITKLCVLGHGIQASVILYRPTNCAKAYAFALSDDCLRQNCFAGLGISTGWL